VSLSPTLVFLPASCEQKLCLVSSMESVGNGGGGTGAGSGAGGDGEAEEASVLVVGFAFMAKKLNSMAKVILVAHEHVSRAEEKIRSICFSEAIARTQTRLAIRRAQP